jgi:hypothetical protein
MSAVRTPAENFRAGFDSMHSVVAASEFIGGRCKAPDNLQLAQKEGWIRV